MLTPALRSTAYSAPFALCYLLLLIMNDRTPTTLTNCDEADPAMPLPPICGRRFKDVLKRKTVSEPDLAKRAHVSRNTIAKMREGETVRESSIQAMCKTLGISRSDIEVRNEQEVELPYRLAPPIHWRISKWLGPWFTCDNQLQYRVAKLQNESVEIKFARAKLYDLLHVEPDRRDDYREHLVRHSKVCALASFDRQRIACNLDTFPLPENGGWWVLDEWPEGELLNTLLGKSKPKWTLSRVAWFGSELLQGLRSLHSAQIIMRELAPEHIFVDEQRVTITDFELARLIGKISVQGKWLSESPYRAPEVANRQPRFESDLYSWGRVLCFVLSGDPNTHPSQIPTLSQYPEIQKLLSDCVHASYKKRPQSADAALARWSLWQPKEPRQ